MEQETKGLKYLEIVNKSVQSKTYTFALFTIAVVAILLLGAIRPTLGKIAQIRKEIEQKRIINEQLTNKTNSLASLTNEYYARSDDMKTLALVYPSQGNFSLVLSNIESLANQYGYVLEGINFGAADKVALSTKVLKPWAMKITIRGNKANLINFIKEIEGMPMYPVVNKVSYSTNNRNRTGQMVYSIEALIYKVDEPNFYKE